MMTMMDNDGNEGNDGIEDIDVLNTCHILLSKHKQYSTKPVLRTGTMKEGTHCNEEGKNM